MPSNLPSTEPGYWMHETSGVLRPIVESYLSGHTLTHGEIIDFKRYLRQWINAPGFEGEAIAALRRDLEVCRTTADLRAWLTRAVDEGVDPL